MEPLSFVLGIVSSVLSGVITDLVTGQSKAARKTEIEKQVALELLKHSKAQGSVSPLLLSQAMKELEILVAEDPDLTMNDDLISLSERIGRFRRTKSINKQLTERLQNLDSVVRRRREQLGLLGQQDKLPTRQEPSLVSPEARQQLSATQQALPPPNWEIASPNTVAHPHQQLEPPAHWKIADKAQPKELEVAPEWDAEIKAMRDRVRRRRATTQEKD